MAVAFGAETERAEMNDHADAIRKAGVSLDALMKGGNDELAKASGWSELRTRVEAATATNVDEVTRIKSIPQLVDDLHDRVQAVGEVSGLNLDPASDTFALVVAGLFEMPKGVEALASSRRAMDLIVEGDTSVSTYMQLSKQAGVARQRLDVASH